MILFEDLALTCKATGISYEQLPYLQSKRIISECLDKFDVAQSSGHLSIGHDCVTLDLDEHEFSYASRLPATPGLLFFDQSGTHQGKIFVLKDVRKVGLLMEYFYGVAYFLTNYHLDYLIVVSWFTIEVKGAKVEGLYDLV